MSEIIKIEHLVKNYYLENNIEQHILKDINCIVNKGDFLAIMGPSGSGKSTFMNILGCLDKATSGKYILNDNDISSLSDKQLAKIRNKYIGFVFQSFNLLPRRTVFDNISIPMIYADIPQYERKDKIKNVLSSVGLSEHEDYYPTQLSGGMQQRVAIARALINNPSIIFADEPTGNLDSEMSVEIMKVFQHLNNDLNITIVMVTHEKDIASYAKRLIYIKDGIKEFDSSMEDAKIKGII